jgi:type II secretory pathway pseudopilin PulG
MAPLFAPRSLSADGGFTIVETIVSLLLIAIVTSAALSLFVRSLSTSSLNTQRQQAVVVAGDQLEYIRGVPVGQLLYGRTQTLVNVLWASPGIVSTAGTVEAYDNTSGHTLQVATIGYRDQPNQFPPDYDTDFTVKTFIDTCYASVTGSSSTGAVTCGTTSTSSTSTMFRIVVAVTWPPGRGETCALTNGTCGY